MEVTNRLEESIKQIRIVKEEVENSEVSQDLEEGIGAIQNALESLEEDTN
jgi:hypothetical protein